MDKGKLSDLPKVEANENEFEQPDQWTEVSQDADSQDVEDVNAAPADETTREEIKTEEPAIVTRPVPEVQPLGTAQKPSQGPSFVPQGLFGSKSNPKVSELPERELTPEEKAHERLEKHQKEFKESRPVRKILRTVREKSVQAVSKVKTAAEQVPKKVVIGAATLGVAGAAVAGAAALNNENTTNEDQPQPTETELIQKETKDWQDRYKDKVDIYKNRDIDVDIVGAVRARREPVIENGENSNVVTVLSPQKLYTKNMILYHDKENGDLIGVPVESFPQDVQDKIRERLGPDQKYVFFARGKDREYSDFKVRPQGMGPNWNFQENKVDYSTGPDSNKKPKWQDGPIVTEE